MLLSTSSGAPIKRFGYKEGLRCLKNAGFDAFDFSARPLNNSDEAPLAQENFMDYIHDVKAAADELGIVCNQAHATFPTEHYGDEEYNRITYKKIIREIEAAAYLGAKMIVVHAVKPLPKGFDAWNYNLEYYRSFIPYCEKFGIKVAVENLFEYDELRERRKPCFIGISEKLARFFDELGSEWFTVCFDVGHAAINVEDPEDAIRTLGSRIGCVHIHDNDFVNDHHTAPYLGKTNWDEVCRAFAEVGYTGDFTLESGCFEGKFPPELMPACYEFEAKVARHLMAKIESCR